MAEKLLLGPHLNTTAMPARHAAVSAIRIENLVHFMDRDSILSALAKRVRMDQVHHPEDAAHYRLRGICRRMTRPPNTPIKNGNLQ